MKPTKYSPWLLPAVLLPLILLRDFTPANELRYLSIADEALRDGHLFTFWNHGVQYADKPPLYLWLVMLGRLLFGSHFMPYLTMLSVVPAMVITAVMNRWTEPYIKSAEMRFAGSLMMMSCGLFLGLAFTLRMDMMMCMFIVLSLHTFHRMYENGAGRCDRLLFPLWLFLAVFSKGAVGIIMPLISTAAFLLAERRLNTFGRYWGWRTWAVLLALCCAWFAGVYTEGGKEYLDNLLFHQTLDRAVASFHHKEPFWYYGVTFWYSLAPWSLLAAVTAIRALRRHDIWDSTSRLFLTVAIATVAMLSCISSKIEIYLAPAFPFFIYFTILMLDRLRWSRLTSWAAGIPAGIFACALPAALILRSRGVAPFDNGWVTAGTAALSACGTAALAALVRKRYSLTLIAVAAGVLSAIFVAGWGLPQLNVMFGYGDMARCGGRLAAEHNCAGYCSFGVGRAENMDVYLGEAPEEVSREDILAGQCAGRILFFRIKRTEHDGELMKYLSRCKYIPFGRFAVAAIPTKPAGSDNF